MPGLELARAFYVEAVRPVLDRRLPRLVHSAALIGYGSEVLGLDTPQSTDHNWGPRVRLFLRPDDLTAAGADVTAALARELPATFAGYPTGHRTGADAWHMDAATPGAVAHRVELFTVAGFCRGQLGFVPAEPVAVADWLVTPAQRLLGTTAGAVFHDGLGELGPLRRLLRRYPDDVWRHLVASGWRRVAQEEAFPGRADQAGDALGARVVTARLVRDLMRLAFLLERAYAPYEKWLGSAFARLPSADDLGPPLERALGARTPAGRGRALADALTAAARLHGASGVGGRPDPSVRPFHGRPFRVLMADRFAADARGRIADPALRARPPIGGIDTVCDSTDVLSEPSLWRRLRPLFEPADDPGA